jgi:hypothetical protein
MSFKHPANRRSAQAPYGDGMFFFTRPVGAPDAISEGEYGDGMFFFTRPVGAPDVISEAEYGDGMFFFTQPVGAPNGAATVPNGAPMSYGAAKPGAALTRKPGAATLNKPTGGRAAPQISADAYKAFEKAAFDVGVWRFWTSFWAPGTRSTVATSGTQGKASEAGVQSDQSKSAYKDALTKYAAANKVLEAAAAPLQKGISGDSAARQALKQYTYALSDQGWYAQAFRNLTGSTRKISKTVSDAVVRDFRAALKTAQGGSAAVSLAQTYLLRDAQSAFTKADFEKTYPGSVPVRRDGESAKAYNARVDEYNIAYFSAGDYAKSVFSSDFEQRRDAVRDAQAKAYVLLPTTVAEAKSAFEAARAAYYAGKTLNLPTQRDGGTRTTTDTTDTTTDTTDTTTVPADTTVPTDTAAAPDITGGPPADAQTLERTTGEEQKVGFLTASGTGEESFVSKYKLWIGLGSVAAIGGGYWWYTQKYLPSKKLGR